MEYEIRNMDELYHWGIKGMRWGVRRYQNKDGSLTPAGKRRLKKETDAIRKEEAAMKNRLATKAKVDKLAARRKALDDKKKALEEEENKKKTDEAEANKKKSADNQAPKKKSLGDMSDEELIRAIERARLEDRYRELRPEPVQVEKTSAGKRVLDEIVVPAAKNAVTDFTSKLVNRAIDKITGGNGKAETVEALKEKYDKLDYKQKIDKILNPDKYLTEEDKNKRQQREFNAEDRAAQKAGYANAAAKAKADADKKAAEAQAKADAKAAKKAAKKAVKEQPEVESTSKEQTKSAIRDEFVFRAKPDADASSRRQSSWEKTTSNIRDEFDFDFSSVSNTPVTSLAKTTVSSGRSTVDNYSSYSYSELLDRSGNVVLSWGDD